MRLRNLGQNAALTIAIAACAVAVTTARADEMKFGWRGGALDPVSLPCHPARGPCLTHSQRLALERSLHESAVRASYQGSAPLDARPR